MRKNTLRHARAWSHPYGHGPFDAVLYADGGGGDGGASDSGSGDEGASSGGGDTGGSSGGDAGQGTGGGQSGGQSGDSGGGEAAPKPKPPASGREGPGDVGGEDPAAKIARLERDLKSANAEAAKARTAAKQQAADKARSEIVQELGKALGLVKDEDTPPDPAELKKQITSAQAAHRDTAVELAVFRAAGKHGADPEALTDSRTFLSSIKDLDPSSSDFAKQVGEAIKQAVEDNPRLKAAGQAPATTSGDFSGGTGEQPKPTGSTSVDDFRKTRRKRREVGGLT